MKLLDNVRFCNLARRLHEAGKVPAQQAWADDILLKGLRSCDRCCAAQLHQDHAMSQQEVWTTCDEINVQIKVLQAGEGTP